MMEITFDGHTPTQRQVTLTQAQLSELFEAMKQDYLSTVTYGTFSRASTYSPQDKAMIKLCDAHNVDPFYKQDRIPFITAVLEQMENPYA